MPDDEVGRFDDVADDVDVTGGRILMTGLREPHSDGRIRNRRTEDRDSRPVRGGEDAVTARLLPQVPPQLVEQLA